MYKRYSMKLSILIMNSGRSSIFSHCFTENHRWSTDECAELVHESTLRLGGSGWQVRVFGCNQTSILKRYASPKKPSRHPAKDTQTHFPHRFFVVLGPSSSEKTLWCNHGKTNHSQAVVEAAVTLLQGGSLESMVWVEPGRMDPSSCQDHQRALEEGLGSCRVSAWYEVHQTWWKKSASLAVGKILDTHIIHHSGWSWKIL